MTKSVTRMKLAKSLQKVEIMTTMSNRSATPTPRSVSARRVTLATGSRFEKHKNRERFGRNQSLTFPVQRRQDGRVGNEPCRRGRDDHRDRQQVLGLPTGFEFDPKKSPTDFDANKK